MTDSRRAALPLAGLAGLLPPLAVLAPKAVVPLLVLAALAVVAEVMVRAASTAERGGGRRLARPAPALAWTLAAIGALALLGALWSPAPGASLIQAGQVAALLAAGGLVIAARDSLDAEARTRVAGALAFGLAVAAALLLLELASGHLLYRAATGRLDMGSAGGPQGGVPMDWDSRLNRGATTLAILAGPALAALALAALAHRHRGGALILAALVALAVALSASHAARLALLAALGLGAVAGAWPRVAAGLLALAAIGAVALPWLAPVLYDMAGDAAWLPESARHRLFIWDFTAARIAEAPWLGWGFDSAGHIPNRGVAPFHADTDSVIPSHPHNAALQLRLDLGVPGVLLGLAGLALAARRALAGASVARAGAAAALGAALTVALLSYGIWQSQWVATLLATVALAGACKPPPSDSLP